MLKVAIYVSSHGFGHASRMAALADELIKYQLSVFLRCDRPDFLFDCLNSPFCSKEDVACDFGVVHSTGLQTDVKATKDELISLFSRRNEIVEREVSWLREQEIDFALLDIPFLAIEACDYAGVPVFAISNFDWFFIYNHVFDKGKELRPLINTIYGLYARVKASFRLPFSSVESMAAFPKAQKVGLLAKRKDVYEDIRELYQIDAKDRILACSFGGEKGMVMEMDKICKAFNGVVISSNQDVDCDNHRYASRSSDWLDLIARCDVLLTKPGYSTFAEASQFGKPILYRPRQNYPEEKVLIKGLARYKAAVEVPPKMASIKAWKSLFAAAPEGYAPSASFRNRNESIAASIVGTYFALAGKQSKLKSVFDIGSNNLNYLVYNPDTEMVLHTAHYTTGLYMGLGYDNCSQFKAIMKTLIGFDKQIKSEKQAISTSVARVRENFSEVSEWLLKHYDLKVKVLKQHQEAAAAYAAAKASLPSVAKPLVVDIGGMSTELAWGSAYIERKGIELGLLSLKDTYYRSFYSLMYQMLPNLENEHQHSSVVTGLTATYIAAAAYNFHYQLPWKGHAKKVRLSQINEIIRFLRYSDDKAKRFEATGMDLFILESALHFVKVILERYEMTECVICYYGISLGYIVSK